jgi:Golgi nucleoside diphosphatase
MTDKPVSFCGYRCDLCPAFIKNVDTLINRTAVRKGWNTFFGFDVPEERIICVGCKNKGAHLDTDCPIRPCALEKLIDNCSFCTFFDTCEKLKSRADIIDELKKKFAGNLSKKEYELFFRPYEGISELKKQQKMR